MDKAGCNRWRDRWIHRCLQWLAYSQSVAWGRMVCGGRRWSAAVNWDQWTAQSLLGSRLNHCLTGWRSYSMGLDRSEWLGAVLDAVLLVLMVLLPVVPATAWYGLTGLLALKWFGFTTRQPKDKGSRALSGLMAAVVINPWFIWNGTLDISQWARMLNWLIMAGLIGSTFTPALIRKWLAYSCLAGFFWLMAGFWQKISGMITPAGWLEPAQVGVITVRIFSVFTNPNNYALYLAVQLVLLTEILRKRGGNPWWRRGCILLWLLTLASLYLTYSRSGWLAGGGYLVWRWWHLWRVDPPRWLRLGWVGIVLTAVMNWPTWGSRLRSLLDGSSNSFRYRMQIWQGVIDALQDYGWQGAGPGSFARLYPWYQQQGSGWVQHAHQWYLQFWLEYGLISLILLAGVVARRLIGADRTNSLGAGLTGAMACFLMVGLVENWSAHLFLGGYFWMIVGLLMAMENGGHGSDE